MMKRHIAITALAASIVVATGASLPGSVEAGSNFICKSMTWGSGKRPVRELARAPAANNWRSNAGPAWNNWLLASSRSKRCRKEGQQWNCVAKAKPCRKLGMQG